MNSTFSAAVADFGTNALVERRPLPPVAHTQVAQAAAAAGHSLPLRIAAEHGVKRNPATVTATKHTVTISLPEKQAMALIRLGRQLFGPRGGYIAVVKLAVAEWLNRRREMRTLVKMAQDQPDAMEVFDEQRSFSASQVHALAVERATPKHSRPGFLMLICDLPATDALALMELGRTLAKEVDLQTMIRVAIVEFLKRRKAA